MPGTSTKPTLSLPLLELNKASPSRTQSQCGRDYKATSKSPQLLTAPGFTVGFTSVSQDEMVAAISDTVPRREKTRVRARRHPKPVGAADELSRTPPGSAERGPGRDARPEGATGRSRAMLPSRFPLPPSPPRPTGSPAHARGIRQTAFLLRFRTKRRIRGGGTQGGAAPRCCLFPDSPGQMGAWWAARSSRGGDREDKG